MAPLEDIVKFGSHLIDAVSAGHSSKNPVIHGDIKDENVGISDGMALMTDYGVSYLMNGGENRKRNIGSIHTMAPELYEDGQRPTTQSDVFSISCVFYKLATGHHPFSPRTEKPQGTGATRDSYEEETQREKTRPDYSHLYAELHLPRELKDMVIKGMQKDPDKRYKDAKEMKEDM